MMARWRPLVLAAAFHLTAAAAVATAQTVIVTKAPPGSTVELALNAAIIGSATADARGVATLPVDLAAHGSKPDSQAYVFVEVCDKVRRVLLVEPGMQAPAAGECTRKEVPGVYVVRKVTTLVVDVSDSGPSVLLRQGSAPPEWLSASEADSRKANAPAYRPGKGLEMFGGGGMAHFGNVKTVECADAPTCNVGLYRSAYSAGATIWLTPFLAAEGAYLKPNDINLNGGGKGYRFNGTRQTSIVTMVGKLGLPGARARAYVMGGATYHRATSTTSETIDERTVTGDGVDTVIPAGTQTFSLRTQGWGWIAGGGIEVPTSPLLSFYSEWALAAVQGADRDGGEGKIDERIYYVLAGLRFRIRR